MRATYSWWKATAKRVNTGPYCEMAAHTVRGVLLLGNARELLLEVDVHVVGERRRGTELVVRAGVEGEDRLADRLNQVRA